MSDPDRNGVTPKQAKALELWPLPLSMREIAAAAAVSERTLRRWSREDEAFITAIREAQADTLRRTTTQLQAAATVAVRILRELAEDDQIPPSVRVTACARLLEGAVRYRETTDLEDRILALEQAQGVKHR